MKGAPWYKWYPGDFAASTEVMLMSCEEQGAYRILLDRVWMDGDISSDPAELAAILRLTEERFAEVWKKVGKCFQPSPKDAMRLTCERIANELEDMINRAETNRKSAETRWESVQKNDAKPKKRAQKRVPKAPKKTVDKGFDANAMRTQCERNANQSQILESDTDTDTDKPIAPSADKSAPVAQKPIELPETWPQEMNDLKRMAVLFLRDFGNCTSEAALKKHGPEYTDVLAIMRNRKGVTPQIAWRAFSDAVEAHDGKPLFGAQCKKALNYLPSVNVTPIGNAPSARQGSLPQVGTKRGWLHGKPVEMAEDKYVAGFSQSLCPAVWTQEDKQSWLGRGIVPEHLREVSA